MIKRYLSILALLFSVTFANELDWVKEQIKAIKPPRSGLSESKVLQIKNPFLFVVEEDISKDKKTKKKTSIKKKVKKLISQKPKDSFKLVAIMNKSALINGKWYKEGSKIGIFKLKKVNVSSVVLSRQKKKVVLKIATKNKKLNFISRKK